MLKALAANIYTWYIWKDISIAFVVITIVICLTISWFNYWNKRR